MSRALLPVLAVGFMLVGVAPLADALAAAADGATATLVARNLEVPVELVFGPDGTLYYAELRTGIVRSLGADGTPSGPVLRVRASPGGNGGFLGLALDPEFGTTGAFYVFYSTNATPDGDRLPRKVNRVSRVAGGVETPVLDNVPWAHLHEGGKLAFLPDGTLLVSVGENGKEDPAQDPGSILGKMLRMRPDGSAPPDNPKAGSLVYASGLRNPFGLAVDPATGTAYFTDNGGDEEVNVLVKGANYGWPDCSGHCRKSQFRDPIVAYEEHFGPTGVAIQDGRLYHGVYSLGQVRRVDLETKKWDLYWKAPAGERVLDVEPGPDGLYVSTFGAIYRLTPPGWSRPVKFADAPAQASPTPTPGPTPSPAPTPWTPGPVPSPGPTGGSPLPGVPSSPREGSAGEPESGAFLAPGLGTIALVSLLPIVAILRKVRR